MKAFSSIQHEDIGHFPPTARAEIRREAAGVRNSLEVVSHQCSVLLGVAAAQQRESDRIEAALEEEIETLSFIGKTVVKMAAAQVRGAAVELIARTHELLNRGESGNVRFFLWNGARRLSSVIDQAHLAAKMLRTANAGVALSPSRSPLAWQVHFAEHSLRDATLIVDRADEELQMAKSYLSEAEIFLERARMARRAILDLLADGVLPPTPAPAAEPFH